MALPAVQRYPLNNRSSGLIERPRLLEKLRDVLAYKLTLVSAPPGYGKTTLAAQFVRQAGYLAAWHTIEERERDVPDLQHHSIAALSHLVPGIQTLATMQGYAADELAMRVADYLRDNLQDNIIYVIDDVHHLAGSPTAEIWLTTLVAHLPPTCHLVLLSRTLPDLPLVDMIARREVLAIGQQELRFTLQEIQYLAFTLLDAEAPIVNVEELAARLEGWPAGTVLALQPLPADLEQILLRGGQGPEALFDALAHSMLRAQPPGLRDFLLASSTLSRLTPELCMAALDLTRSADRLAEAQAHNLFLARTPGGLAYHTLFRNFLQRQLKASNPDLYISLHARAARWFADADEIDLAFDHYMSAGFVTQAAVLTERVSHAYFVQGKVETLLGWRAQLKQIGASVPELAYNCARIHIDRYDYGLAESELMDAEAGFAARNDARQLTEIKLQRAMIHLQRGNYAEAAVEAETLLTTASLSGHLRGRALRILGNAWFNLGQVEAGIRHLEESLILHRSDGDQYALTNLLQDLQFAYEHVGRVDDLAACLQELVALRRSLGASGALAIALNNLGSYYHQRGDYLQALAIFQEGLSIAAKAPNKRAESYLLWSLADLQRDRNAYDVALTLYNKGLELLGSSESRLRSAILASVSTLHRWQGQYEEAVALAEEAAALAEQHKIALAVATARAVMWAARAQLGQTEVALASLESIADYLQNQSMEPMLVGILGLSAEVALLRGDAAAADNDLRRALRIGERAGGLQPLAAEISHSKALSQHINRHLTKFLIISQPLKQLEAFQARFSDEARVSKNTVAPVTYSLRIQTLGQESIDLDGARIPTSAWRATTVREVLLYLVFSGPISREQLGLVFWPDSSSGRLRSSFHTSLYRMRQALGENVIAYQDGLYSISPDVQVWCDAHEFEALILQARLLSPRDARTEDLWRKAIQLYKGDFLLSLDRDWVYSRREALREFYLEALVGLGECIRTRHDLRGALSIFKKALDVDPYREDVHRAILVCYAEMGEKRQLLSHIQQLKNLFLEELSTVPSAETLALANSLLN